MERKIKDRLITLIESKIDSLGYECIEVAWLANEAVFQVFIEKKNKELVDHIDCSKVSNIVVEMEIDKLVSEKEYSLEVSSPGPNRPLRKIVDFQQALNKDVCVSLQTAENGIKTTKGKLTAIHGNDKLQLQTKRGLWEFSFHNIDTANIE